MPGWTTPPSQMRSWTASCTARTALRLRGHRFASARTRGMATARNRSNEHRFAQDCDSPPWRTEHDLPTAAWRTREGPLPPATHPPPSPQRAKTITFGAELPPPAMLASVDNSLAFTAIVDDCDTINTVTRVRLDRPRSH